MHTPGHSDDSVSLLLDNGAAFTGDLTQPTHVGQEDPEVVAASWRMWRDRGARRVYPAHGPLLDIDAEKNLRNLRIGGLLFVKKSISGRRVNCQSPKDECKQKGPVVPVLRFALFEWSAVT